MCFLEREVYAFLSTFDKRGERVRGAMPWARIFCLWEGRRKRRGRRAMGRPRMVVGRHARRACGQSSAGRAACEGCAEKRKSDVFFFLRKRSGDAFFLLWMATIAAGAQLPRPWGIGPAAKNDVCADCGTRWNRDPACRGLIPFQLIQIIYLRYLCVGTEREKWMDVYFLLTLYI